MLSVIFLISTLLLAVLPQHARAQSLSGISPAQGEAGAAMSVTITGTNTTFQIASGTSQGWIQQGADIIPIALDAPLYDTTITGSLFTGCAPSPGFYTLFYSDTDPATPYDTLQIPNAFEITGNSAVPTFTPHTGFLGETITFGMARCSTLAPIPANAIHKAWLFDGSTVVPLDTVIATTPGYATGTLEIPCELPAGTYQLQYSYTDTVTQLIDTITMSGSIDLTAQYTPLNAQLNSNITVDFMGIGHEFTMGTSTLNEAWLERGADMLQMTGITTPSANNWQGDVTIPSNADGGYWDVYYRQANTVTLSEDTTLAFCPLKVCLSPNCDFVWPGDADYNGVVNNLDILPIGQGFGTAGPLRTPSSIAWQGFAAADWGNTFPTWGNYKHADCDGNGTITYPDTLAVTQNYTEVHYKNDLVHDVVRGGAPPLSIHIENAADSMDLGDTLRARIELGSNAVPANGTYGIAFTIRFPPELMDEASIYFKSESDWLGDEGVNKLKFHKLNYETGRVEAAITRIDQTNISGQGKIADFGGATADNLSGKANNLLELLKLSITDVTLVDVLGDELPYSTLSDSIVVVSTPDGPLHNDRDLLGLHIYPNPAKDQLTVRTTKGIDIETLTIYDAVGRLIYTSTPNRNAVQLRTENIPDGMYLIETITANKRSVRRITITH